MPPSNKTVKLFFLLEQKASFNAFNKKNQPFQGNCKRTCAFSAQKENNDKQQ